MRSAALILLLTFCLLAACAPAQAPQAASSAGNGAGLVVDVSGDAALKRQGWQDYAPIAFGAAVHRGDLIRLAGASRAVVACADLNLAELSGGVKRFPCSAEARTPIVFEGALVSPTRGDQGLADYPLVLAPRKTRLLNDRPLLQWAPVAGATAYTVTIQGASWQTIVSGATELLYPADAPALEPGKSYRLVIEAGGRSSSEETGPDLGFTILPASEAQQIRADESRARGLPLSDAAARLLVANLYAAHQLYSEALQTLGAPAIPETPALARLEGDLSLSVGLIRSAEAAYLQALEKSTSAGDLEGQALAGRALGQVYRLIGNAEEANLYYQRARSLYDQLGDKQAVVEIDTALK